MNKHYGIKIVALLALALWCNGCAGTKTVNYSQLWTASMAHYGDTYPDTTYYCGTQDGFDYFYVEYGAPHYNPGKRYRILSEDSPIKKRFEWTKDRDQWVKVTLQEI